MSNDPRCRFCDAPVYHDRVTDELRSVVSGRLHACCQEVTDYEARRLARRRQWGRVLREVQSA